MPRTKARRAGRNRTTGRVEAFAEDLGRFRHLLGILDTLTAVDANDQVVGGWPQTIVSLRATPSAFTVFTGLIADTSDATLFAKTVAVGSGRRSYGIILLKAAARLRVGVVQ